MDSQQLRYFVCVAENQNISKAARALSISQPALSRSIRVLEEEMGVVLFVRKNNGIDLTDAGVLFLEKARMLLEMEYTMKRDIRNANNERQCIHIILRCIETFIPDIIRQFQEKNPLVDFCLLQNDDIALQNHQCDLIISGALADETGYVRTRLLSERFLFAVPKNHPVAQQDVLSQTELAKLGQIQFGGHRQVQWFIKDALQKLGITDLPRVICDDVQMGCCFVSAGFGALLIPEYAIDDSFLHKIKLMRVEGVEIVRDIYLYTRANFYLSEYTTKFISFFYCELFSKAGRKGTCKKT